MNLTMRDAAHVASDSQVAAAPERFDTDAVAARVAAQLQHSAVERDQAGGHPARERELLRASGLLLLAIPRAHGGHGANWPTIFRATRRIAEVDAALAHLLGFHHLQIAGLIFYGSPEQQRRLLRASAQQALFWGNALNPLDKRLIATAHPQGGYVLDGIKSFASGSVGSDMLTISAWDAQSQTALIGAIPSTRTGVSIDSDWDSFGQRQTDSGTVTFASVRIEADEVLQDIGVTPSAFATLRCQVAQLHMTNLFLGIGLGAFAEALRYTREEARPWFASGVARSSDDPYVQQRYGELGLQLRAASALSDAAAEELQEAFEKGAALTPEMRGGVAIAVAQAKVLAHRAALAVAEQMFEATGARSTSARYGFDRFWRNARVHTLHDPIDYKLRDLGRFHLSGQYPEPTPYS